MNAPPRTVDELAERIALLIDLIRDQADAVDELARTFDGDDIDDLHELQIRAAEVLAPFDGGLQ